MSLQYVDEYIYTNGCIDEIHSVYIYIHTLHKILFCAPLRTKTPNLMGEKGGKRQT